LEVLPEVGATIFVGVTFDANQLSGGVVPADDGDLLLEAGGVALFENFIVAIAVEADGVDAAIEVEVHLFFDDAAVAVVLVAIDTTVEVEVAMDADDGVAIFEVKLVWSTVLVEVELVLGEVVVGEVVVAGTGCGAAAIGFDDFDGTSGGRVVAVALGLSVAAATRGHREREEKERARDVAKIKRQGSHGSLLQMNR